MFPEMVIEEAVPKGVHQSNDSVANHAPSASDHQALLVELKESREKVCALQNSLESALSDLAQMRLDKIEVVVKRALSCVIICLLI